MVVVMAPDATAEDVARVVARVEAAGGEAFVSRGVTRTIIGLVGDVDAFGRSTCAGLPGVSDVRPDHRALQAGQPASTTPT